MYREMDEYGDVFDHNGEYIESRPEFAEEPRLKLPPDVKERQNKEYNDAIDKGIGCYESLEDRATRMRRTWQQIRDLPTAEDVANN